tara:strand:- start:102 stop:551 length:450 start_codon:yes stop_codon:yes gene_type:complete
MKQFILLLISLTLLFSEHPEHPEHPSEHPTTKKEPKLTIDDLTVAIENYIQDDMILKGGFFIYDKNNKEILDLTLTKIHKERLSNIGVDTYFACADFKASNGKIYDLDLFMTGKSHDNLDVTEISVHKENGKARYLWEYQKEIWVKVNK